MPAKDQRAPEFRGDAEGTKRPVDYQLIYSDGSVPAWKKGHYWRRHFPAMNAGYYGPQHGPFGTEDEARKDAEEL